MDIKVFYFNPLRECCYVVWDDAKECAVIDPGCCDDNEFARLAKFIDATGLKPVRVLLTHGHFDHIAGLRKCWDAWRPLVNIHQEDIFQVEFAPRMAQSLGFEMDPVGCPFETVSDGDEILFGGISIKVLHTPGHTAGSLCFYAEKEKTLFSGDTLFAGGAGRTDLPKGNANALSESLNARIAVLPEDVEVLPGHGYPTSVGAELRQNPYLSI